LSRIRTFLSGGTLETRHASIAEVPLPVIATTVWCAVPRKMRRSLPVIETISSENVESRWQTSWWTSALLTVAVVLTGPGLRSV
jgi:hypothetical protein